MKQTQHLIIIDIMWKPNSIIVTLYSYIFQTTRKRRHLPCCKSLRAQHRQRAWKPARLWTQHDQCNIHCKYWVTMSTSQALVLWLNALKPAVFCKSTPHRRIALFTHTDWLVWKWLASTIYFQRGKIVHQLSNFQQFEAILTDRNYSFFVSQCGIH